MNSAGAVRKNVDATQLAAAATLLGAVGTFLSPLIALRVSRYLDEVRERDRRRLELFQILMQWRAALFAEQPVRALNLIDILFYNDKAVRDAWADCFSSFQDQRLSTTPEGGRIRQEKLMLSCVRWQKPLDMTRSFQETILHGSIIQRYLGNLI